MLLRRSAESFDSLRNRQADPCAAADVGTVRRATAGTDSPACDAIILDVMSLTGHGRDPPLFLPVVRRRTKNQRGRRSKNRVHACMTRSNDPSRSDPRPVAHNLGQREDWKPPRSDPRRLLCFSGSTLNTTAQRFHQGHQEGPEGGNRLAVERGFDARPSVAAPPPLFVLGATLVSWCLTPSVTKPAPRPIHTPMPSFFWTASPSVSRTSSTGTRS